MKRRDYLQKHPNQEDKTGKATFASTTSINSSTMGKKPSGSDLPDGPEADYKNELLKSKKK